MNKILIDKSLFSFENKLLKGFISGLKILSDSGFKLFTNKKPISKLFSDLISLEEISLSNSGDDKEGKTKLLLFNDKIVVENLDGKTKKFKSFLEAAKFIAIPKRIGEVARNTSETKIKIKIDLDGTGKSNIKTGIGFFDHMLEQIARHGNSNLYIKTVGDLHIDEHHTVEDTGIALGEAILIALGSKTGIKRYGFYLPMDESIAQFAMDLGGRTHLNFNCDFSREKVGELPTELVQEFFAGLARGLKANIFIKTEGTNDHHKIEATFKAFAKSLNEACRIDDRAKGRLPSTKGKL